MSRTYRNRLKIDYVKLLNSSFSIRRTDITYHAYIDKILKTIYRYHIDHNSNLWDTRYKRYLKNYCKVKLRNSQNLKKYLKILNVSDEIDTLQISHKNIKNHEWY